MAANVIMPQMGESIFEGTITKWLKKIGDAVNRDEPLFEISTDKVDSEIPAPASGVLSEIRVQEGDTVQINTVVAVIDDSDEAGAKAQPEASETAIRSKPSVEKEPESRPERRDKEEGKRPIRSSPLVRRIAKEENVDLNEVEGSGLGGRITKQDVLNHLSERERIAEVARPLVQQAQQGSVPSRTSSERIEVVPMSPMRRSIAEHMVESRRTSAHVTTVFEVDMTSIVTLRSEVAEDFRNREGIKLSYMLFFFRVVAEALKESPAMNASIEGTKIIYRKDINLGMAVALDWGLVVPVIRNADEKSFLGLAKAAVDLANRARQKKLTTEDVQGGTFTITNPGIFGSLLGTPIIHQPQVAILCIGAITKRPVVVSDAIAIRSMVYLTLTFDHRLIDGAVADLFMSSVKAKLEGWEEKIV